VTAGNPPFKRVLDVLDWFPKVLPQLAGMRPSLFSHGDVGIYVVENFGCFG